MVPDDGIRPDAYPSWYFRPMAPVSGAISVCRKRSTMSTSATNQPNRQSPVRNHLPTGISHTKMSPERTPQDAKAHWGILAVHRGRPTRSGVEQTVHPAPSCCDCFFTDPQLVERSGCLTGRSILQFQSVIAAEKNRCETKRKKHGQDG